MNQKHENSRRKKQTESDSHGRVVFKILCSRSIIHYLSCPHAITTNRNNELSTSIIASSFLIIWPQFEIFVQYLMQVLRVVLLISENSRELPRTPANLTRTYRELLITENSRELLITENSRELLITENSRELLITENSQEIYAHQEFQMTYIFIYNTLEHNFSETYVCMWEFSGVLGN